MHPHFALSLAWKKLCKLLISSVFKTIVENSIRFLAHVLDEYCIYRFCSDFSVTIWNTSGTGKWE